jgi:small-conductance mechanosensitive channel
MLQLILLKYRTAAILIVAGLIASACFAAGWKANGHLLGLKHAVQISVKEKEIDRLDKELLTQNAAVALLGEQRAAAVRARDKAEQALKDLMRASAARQSAADKIPATNCLQMLEELKRIQR